MQYERPTNDEENIVSNNSGFVGLQLYIEIFNIFFTFPFETLELTVIIPIILFWVYCMFDYC